MSWLMFPAGILISVFATFTGVGGGVVWMAILLSLDDVPPAQAVTCALVIQIFGMASGVIANVRMRLIDWRLVAQQMSLALPLSVVAALVGRGARPDIMKLVLGLLTFLIAYLFLRGDDLFAEGASTANLQAGRSVLPVAALGGAMTGWLSVGIGDWLVPLFNRRCGLTMARSVATGVALMLPLAVAAAAVHVAVGAEIRWELAGPAIPAVVLGGQIGCRLHRWMPEARVKEAFVLVLVYLAAHMVFNSL